MTIKYSSNNTIILDDYSVKLLVQATLNTSTVNGHTHNFYRYPARFSPIFVRQIISQFSKPGDLIIDPFVGGGTTIVEARALGRRAVGVDINSLATFISKAKTTLFTKKDTSEISKWFNQLPNNMNLHKHVDINIEWLNYFRNIDCKKTWPLRNSIQLAINQIIKLQTNKQQTFARCALLKTAQWALDSQKKLPTASEFRSKYLLDAEIMIAAISNYSANVRKADKGWDANGLHRVKVLNRSTVGIDTDQRLFNIHKPRLILTSPPYPGVHVLYHRWQVNGRRETSAPYWIANKLDGSGASYYTFGDRKAENLADYYTNTYKTFKSLANLSGKRTLLVQMIAFSKPSWQLPLYLDTLSDAGFKEYKVKDIANRKDGRLWRKVPNRKWHANLKGKLSSSKEVVLFHKLK